MRKLKTFSADCLTHFICGGGVLVTAITAVCLSLMILGCGVMLATVARQARTQLAESTILSEIMPVFSRSENVRPEKTALFLNYINALAPAVLNMELLPEKQLAAFDPLYEAAQVWQITLQQFTFEESTGKMHIVCDAGSEQTMQNFCETLRGSEYFSSLECMYSMHTIYFEFAD